jgi:Bacterial Ig-like domain (group 2)
MRINAFVMLLLIGAAGCGGGGGSNNPGPTPVPTGITIVATSDMLKLRATDTFSLRATFDNGTTNTVQGTWSTDNQSVASVDGTGRVTGAGSGEATITGTYQGLRATQRLRVVPDYQGRWNGGHRVTKCTADGDFLLLDFCSEFGAGSVYVLTMGFTQNRDTVSGTSNLGDAPATVQGSIRPTGQLDLSGTFTIFVDVGVVIDVTLVDWEATTTDNSTMTGDFSLTFRVAQFTGSARVDNDLSNFNKTSATPSVFERPGEGRPFLDAVKEAIGRK